MHVTVKLYATLRRYRPEQPRGAALPIEVPSGATVSQVIERLGIPDAAPLVAMVNNAVRTVDYVLAEGDTLSLFPPVSGG